MEESNKKLYSLPIEYVFELIVKTENLKACSRDLIAHLVEENKCSDEEHIFSLACEIYWLNHTALNLLNKEIDTASFTTHSENEADFIIPLETLKVLQSMLVSNYYANIELNRLSFSVSIH